MGWIGSIPDNPIIPSGASVIGGDEIYLPAGSSYAYTTDFAVFSSFFEMNGYSEELTSDTIDITGYGTREGYSENITISVMDVSRGLTVINELGIISTDTNVLRFYGDTLYSGGTLNKRSDATVSSEGKITIDGGDAPTRDNAETITGGDAINDNITLDGGNA